jgi:hypothetical protein
MIFSCLRFKEQHLSSPKSSPASEGSRQVRDMVNQAVEQILVARKSQVMSRVSMSKSLPWNESMWVCPQLGNHGKMTVKRRKMRISLDF